MKTSGFVVAVFWAMLFGCCAFTVAYGYEWFSRGQLKICLPEDIMPPPFGKYRSPENPDDMKSPRYWCAYKYQQAKLAEEQWRRTHDPYEDLSQFWGDDIISNLFSNLGRLLDRWGSETVKPWFLENIAPIWNEYFAGDAPDAETHRHGIGWLASVIFAAFVGVVLKMTADWTHERVLLKHSSQP